jgi:hypothetical protein
MGEVEAKDIHPGLDQLPQLGLFLDGRPHRGHDLGFDVGGLLAGRVHVGCSGVDLNVGIIVDEPLPDQFDGLDVVTSHPLETSFFFSHEPFFRTAEQTELQQSSV